jgi:hypothetical protein
MIYIKAAKLLKAILPETLTQKLLNMKESMALGLTQPLAEMSTRYYLPEE